MNFLKSFKQIKSFIEESYPWNGPARYYLYREAFHRKRKSEYSTEAHIAATLKWLKTAQDASRDGGVSGRYHLRTGWSPSYPETTGYIVPTFLDLANRHYQENELIGRAERMVSFLLKTQMPEGAFPGGEVGSSKPHAIVFNTGQIIQGLVCWYQFAKDNRALEAAVRACRWLLEVQDADGSWRKHTYAQRASSYHARVAWPLAECGVVTAEAKFLNAAERHLDWILRQANHETGWIDLMGFYESDHANRCALTHTIAYTYRGLMELATILRRDDCWELIRKAGERLLRRLELRRSLAAVFNHEWREQADYVCLTGCAQIAGIWSRLFRRFDDIRFLNVALKALDLVKDSQILNSPFSVLNGAVAGSSPVWGAYLRFAFPNWAAKFFIDALLHVQDSVSELSAKPPQSSWSVPTAVPRVESLVSCKPQKQVGETVLLSTSGSTKGYEIGSALLEHGIRPKAVVLDVGTLEAESLGTTLRNRVRDYGPGQCARDLWSRLSRRRTLPTPAQPTTTMDTWCQHNGIACLPISGINSAASRQLLNSLQPDILILAGVGMVRKEILEIPRRGTLNAHMGLLPFFRGMNVVEWAALTGSTLGCTVHYVDSGVDTGRILAVQEVSPNGAKSINELRSRVNRFQVKSLCVVTAALVNGLDLPTYAQSPDEGLQFFLMHPILKNLLEHRLTRESRTGSAGMVACPVDD